MTDINYKIRKLEERDITIDYFELLQQLTIISLNEFNEDNNTNFFNSLNENHQIYVIEELENKKIIGSATIWIEPKLIRNYSRVAHLEDIVIDSKFRGFGLGKKIVETLLKIARDNNCYKCVLNCEPALISFYQNIGFINYGKHLRLDF